MKIFKQIKLQLILTLLLACAPANCAELSSLKLKTLYNSLDPSSLSQHLAFYELYPNTLEGQHSLQHVWKLLSGNDTPIYQQISQSPTTFTPDAIHAIVDLVNKQSNKEAPLLSDDDLAIINKVSARLLNRKLKGFYVTNESEVLQLPPEDIDLARGLLISQLSEEENGQKKIQNYEAMLDLMALQILTSLHLDAKPEDKIRAINRFIFEDMAFRFPPHSLYAKDIDLYTFLPAVLDSRRGVCLGVSILYLCLAQRLGLPLESVTPPGHIYIRYHAGDQVINIETTARGIHIDSDEYLSVETRSLQERNIKEVIGLAHFNQASVHWKNEDYPKAISSYQVAHKYLPNDMLLKELLGYNYLFNGDINEGTALLKQVKDYIPDYAVSRNDVAEDFINGNVDVEGLKSILAPVDENRESVLKKRDEIQETMKRNPKFRSGLFNLAITWLQLHRAGEALEVLEQYHHVNPEDPTAEYYLTVLFAQRLDYNKAWEHLHQAEKLVKKRNHEPKTIKELRKQLALCCPE